MRPRDLSFSIQQVGGGLLRVLRDYSEKFSVEEKEELVETAKSKCYGPSSIYLSAILGEDSCLEWATLLPVDMACAHLWFADAAAELKGRSEYRDRAVEVIICQSRAAYRMLRLREEKVKFVPKSSFEV